jgi:hypothetical protein
MLCWLKQQVRVLEAWREELACRSEILADVGDYAARNASSRRLNLAHAAAPERDVRFLPGALCRVAAPLYCPH